MYTIPFDSDTLKSIITGEVISPEINYADSTIKGKNFITYFSNLKYKDLNIDFSTVELQEKTDLICEFIKHNSTCHIEQLEATVLKCLFFYKKYDLSLVDTSEKDKIFLQKSILSNTEIKSFVEQNISLIKELADLLDGILLFAIKNLNAYSEELGQFITNNIVVEKQQIGKTFVNMLSNESFNFHYYAALPKFDDIKYFDYYYDRPIYSGKTLIYYLTLENCLVFPILKMILDMQFTPDQLNQIYRETDAALI
jgi:hypothetical protein